MIAINMFYKTYKKADTSTKAGGLTPACMDEIAPNAINTDASYFTQTDNSNKNEPQIQGH